MPKRTHTMKDVATLRQLSQATPSQLVLGTEFQRNAVWPRAAKAYLIDTILSDRPIPYLYFRRSISAQSGRPIYEVIDGQQRLRSLFEFLDDGFALIESRDKAFKGKRFSELSEAQRTSLLSYDLYVEELTGYSDADITDMFVRMNRFVVKLSSQEIRHAKFQGKFKDFVETLSALPFWKSNNVFTDHQINRMRAVELSAEFVILLIEGPQDKKNSIDIYYGQYEKTLPFRKEIESRFIGYLAWIEGALPGLAQSRFRKPTDLYALVGALEHVGRRGPRRKPLDPARVGAALQHFEVLTRRDKPQGEAARYLAAASRQTDNFAPRLTRIEILADVIRAA